MGVSHVGLRVRDLDASTRFFEALGFEVARRLAIPDAMAADLLSMTPPIGFEAVYLRNGPFVLQLLTFSGYPAPEESQRTMVGAGMTHLSIAVDDIQSTASTIEAAGGTIESVSRFACVARTPEGQLIELIHSSMQPVSS